MRWMHLYAANRNVFNDRLKLFPSMTRSRLFEKLSNATLDCLSVSVLTAIFQVNLD